MDIDLQAAPSDAKAKSKSGKDASGKKRFEVKKVSYLFVSLPILGYLLTVLRSTSRVNVM